MSCAAPVDLEDICNRRLGTTRRLGLKGYVRELLGLTMEKPMDVTRSDWEKPELDAAQVRHACIDAYVSYKLGERVLITN
uniref:3'-5' exonuclease domain-containing protein n=2 Tax=Oryza brachyantha TaxID=4533 RepID=J3KZ24_ORYBR